MGREGNGTVLQYSYLENPMDGGAWWATVHGVIKRRTRDFTSLPLANHLALPGSESVFGLPQEPPTCA